jgi:polysaccharide pyruvyl transferase WcaK-like protein
MTRVGLYNRRPNSAPAPRVGLFGLLGLGNFGNEAALESVLTYLRRDHPTAVLDAMTGGYERVRDAYGLATTPLVWYEGREVSKSRLVGILQNATGKLLIDPLRIVFWVRNHDVIIVPGMGVLEATLPLRPYGFPTSLFVLCAAGKLFKVKVALVSVGASVIKQRMTRFLITAAARMAAYRSYRDRYSMKSMLECGVDTSDDRSFADLAFALPVPPYRPGDPQLVGLGVMDYNGGNDDRARAEEIHSAYVEETAKFAHWLLENGYSIRLFGGDENCDYAVAEQIIAKVREQFSGTDAPARMALASFSSYAEMLREMNQVGTVVATRFHNVLGSLKLGKPTIAIGYSQKFFSLMESMGLSEFIQSARELDADKLIMQFEEAQRRRAELLPAILKRDAYNSDLLAEQFDLLTTSLFPGMRAWPVEEIV